MDGSATSDKVGKSVKNKNSKTKLRDSDTENVNKNTNLLHQYLKIIRLLCYQCLENL